MGGKKDLFERLRQLSRLKGVASLLMWDGQVNMPLGAGAARAQQRKAVAGVIHELATAKELGDLLTTVETDPSACNEWEAASVRNARRDWNIATSVPMDIAQREAMLQQDGVAAWLKAKQAADFSLFAPVLEEWLGLLRRKAAAIDATLPVYDVLVEQYERGFSTARLTSIFEAIKAELLPLIQAVKAAQASEGAVPSRGALTGMEFDVAKQQALSEELVKTLGFDLTRGRFDKSVHPFTIGIDPTDVRLTARYKADNLFEGITASIHETGHALYEQNLPARPEDQLALPVCKALGMGIHESQSLFMERMVGLDEPFWKHQYPALVLPTFPELAEKIPDSAEFYRCLNVVRPGANRVEADELTYPLHIIMRWEIEVELLNGTLEVADVPVVWKRKIADYLGVDVANDASGALQDMHWAFGMLGYFPTYVLGAVYAAQFHAAAKEQIPGLDEALSRGDVAVVCDWLRTNIHSQGALPANGDELCQKVTGAPLDTTAYLTYLKTKYSKLYAL